MNAQYLTEIAERVADIAATSDDPITHVEIVEMADGSTRTVALVTTYDRINELEQVFRVSSPPSDDAPAWVNDNLSWMTELRIGDGWMLFDIEDAAATREP